MTSASSPGFAVVGQTHDPHAPGFVALAFRHNVSDTHPHYTKMLRSRLDDFLRVLLES